MLVKDKNIVVTGARRGIGKATVKKLAEQGANIWACVRNFDEEFEENLAKLKAEYGVWIKPVYFDFNDEEQIKEGVKIILRDKIKIDAIANIAGIAEYTPFSMTALSDMKKIMNVNYFAPMYFTQLLSRRMGGESQASIIFTSSISGLRGEDGNIAYGCSKAVIAHATRILSKELAKNNIRVNAIAPGLVDTDMKNKADDIYWENLVNQVYLKRAASAEEIANVVAFLISDMSSYINGQIIRIDGGLQ